MVILPPFERFPIEERVALLGAGFVEAVRAGSETRFLEGDGDELAPLVVTFPGHTDFVLAMEDDVVGMAVLLPCRRSAEA
jgi:hypothetical protein